MNKNALSELPKGWIWARLEELVLDPKNDIVDGPFGSNLKASEYVNKGIPIIRLQNVTRNQFIKKNIQFINPEKAEQLKRHSFSKSDIVITKLGAPLGEACLVPDDIEWGIIVADIVRLRIDEKYVSKKYLVYCINSEVVIKQFEINTKGTTRPRVNLNHIRELELPISPLPEQHRIVTKIEELFTKLDAGVEVLKKTEVQLKRYRQSLLNSAFEGKLVPTEAELAKSEGRAYEPADVLLERLFTERRVRWGNREPEALDTSGLPELPEGWVWTRVGDVSELIRYGYTASSTNEPVGPKMLRISDIQNNFVNWDTVPYCKIDSEEKQKYLLKDGDLVFARTGATVGKSFLIRGNIPEAVFASYLIRIILSVHVEKEFVYNFFQSNRYWLQIHERQIGIGQPSVNALILSGIVLPLPPLAEQRRIVAEARRRFSVADEVEKVVEKSLTQAERLRQSILKKAFEGKLVPQDSSDEPASILLARIKEEKAKSKDLGHKRIKRETRGQQMGENTEHERRVETQVRLYDILQQSKKSLTPNQLWESSGLDIEDFYAQLKMEVQSGRISEKRPNDTDVFLEAAK